MHGEREAQVGFRAVWLFLGLTVGLSAIFWALVIISGKLSGAGGIYVAGLMWCPGIAALLTCRFTGAPVGGWGLGAPRWCWIAYLLPLGYAALAYGIVWITGS